MAKNKQTPTNSSPFSFHSSTTSAPGQAESSAANPTESGGKSSKRRGRLSGKTRLDADDGSGLFSAPDKVQDNPGDAYGYRRSLRGHKDEVSIYNEQMAARHAMDRRTKVIAVSLVILILLIPITLILPTGLFGSGTRALTPALFVEYLTNNVTGLVNWLTGGPVTSGVSIVFWQILAAVFVGAALSLSGCVYQGALKNALAAPSTLGVMSGGTLGTLIYTVFFIMPTSEQEATRAIRASELQAQLESMDVFTYIFTAFGRSLCSLAGSLIIVALVLLIAHIAGRGKVSKVALLIAGQVFAALIAGVISVIRTYIMYYGTVEQEQALQSIVGGSLSSIVGPTTFLVLAVPIIIGIVIMMFMRMKLNLLAFGDDEARSMGIKTMSTRNFSIIICTILTAVVVSFVGSVGFVGFLVPHLARKVVGPDFRFLIPTSIVFGSIFMVVVFYFTNLTTIFSGSIGTLTSILGVVFFLIVVIRERARGNVDWI